MRIAYVTQPSDFQGEGSVAGTRWRGKSDGAWRLLCALRAASGLGEAEAVRTEAA